MKTIGVQSCSICSWPGESDEIIGAGGAAGISSAYYPSQYCTWTKTGQRWLTNVILDGANLVVREFWPDVHSALRHHRD